jgi:hypothetical protein
VYAEKAGAFFCHLLGFEHGCSYIADAGAQEREFKNATNICEKSWRTTLLRIAYIWGFC